MSLVTRPWGHTDKPGPDYTNRTTINCIHRRQIYNILQPGPHIPGILLTILLSPVHTNNHRPAPSAHAPNSLASTLPNASASCAVCSTGQRPCSEPCGWKTPRPDPPTAVLYGSNPAERSSERSKCILASEKSARGLWNHYCALG
jgi:hypothetical protein